MPHAVRAERCPQQIALAALFVAFLKVSLCGFGGPLIWARRMIVEKQGWLNDQEFAEVLSFCQFLPGPNVVSLALCIGAKFRGTAGAFAALAGFVVIPWLVGFGLGTFFLSYAHFGLLQNILRGISAAAAGLLIGTGLRLMRPHRGQPMALLFAAAAFAGSAFARLPLVLIIVMLLPLSIAAASPKRATGA
jgi:chromate transporter